MFISFEQIFWVYFSIQFLTTSSCKSDHHLSNCLILFETNLLLSILCQPSTDMMSASPAIVGKRTPLSIRAQPNPNIASSATRSMKKTLGTSNSLKKTRINESLDPSPSVQNSSVIPVHEDEIDVDGPGECNTQ